MFLIGIIEPTGSQSSILYVYMCERILYLYQWLYLCLVLLYLYLLLYQCLYLYRYN